MDRVECPDRRGTHRRRKAANFRVQLDQVNVLEDIRGSGRGAGAAAPPSSADHFNLTDLTRHQARRADQLSP